MTARTLEQLAPYAHVIAWGVIGAASLAGAAVGAILGATLTRRREQQ